MPPSAPEPLAFTVVPQGSEPRLAVEPEPQNVDGVHPAAITPDPDDEPIVILDDGPSPAALAYLAAQGIGADTAAAFRIDAVSDGDLARLLTPRQRAHLTASGIWLPTMDPRSPATITGLIRLTPAQHLHRHIGPVAGIAGAPGLAEALRVVLVDNPLLGLRLHERGVAGIAIVEDPAVLIALADWLAAREVVTITTAKHGDLPLPPGIVPVGTGRIIGALAHAPAATLALLGLDPAALRAAPVATTPLDLRVVHDLHAYAVRQLETTAGMTALRAAGLERADLIAAYRPGYLPAGYRDLLPAEQRQHFDRAWKGNAILLPAFDAQGVIVDLLVCAPASNHVTHSLWSAPRGLLAPILATACEHLIVTDTPRRLGRLLRDGIPPLLLRGVADAQAHVARLVAGGVRSVEVHAHRDGDAIAAALRSGGLSVTVTRNPYGQHPASLAALRHGRGEADAADAPVPEPEPAPTLPSPAPLPTLVLVSHDRQAERAVFTFAAGTYAVTVPHRPTSTLTVAVTGPLRTQSMSGDLAVDTARQRLVAMLALNTGLTGPEVSAALIALLPAVLALVEPTAPAVVPLNPSSIAMRANERDEAMALLTASDLVERATAALGHLGADAADPATSLALLAAVSRLSDRPLWLALSAAMPSERFPALAAIAQATPPDQIVHVTRLTAEALNHHDPEALRHKLLLLGDAAEISERAATSLRLFHDRGVLTTSTVERSTQYGGLRTRIAEVHGPIAVLAAATAALPHGLDHHLFGVSVDDSPEAQVRQRQAAVAPLADPAALAASQRRRASAIRRLQNAQRLLVPRPVAIPDLATISLPAALARTRLHHDTLVGLIQASALLHQHQRPTVEGCVVATSADTELAVRLLHHVAALQSAGLSRPAHRVLTALWSAKLTTFAMPDLHRLLGWDRHLFRSALDELMRLDYIVAPRGVRGQFREYRLVAIAPVASNVVPMPVTEAAEPEVAHG